MNLTRRDVIAMSLAAAIPKSLLGQDSLNKRIPIAQRAFTSQAVEEYLAATAKKIGDPELRAMFLNCFPNTLDTTVRAGTYNGKPDTVVITGDIPAMWLRDSSAQVWPYLPLAKRDEKLRAMLEGVIRRQARCLLIDPYANAFLSDLTKKTIGGAIHDKTEMKTGVWERKYELDSLCYPIRLSHGYWKHTGDTQPFDATWAAAMRNAVKTMREQQRKQGPGPYRFQRVNANPTESLWEGTGYPVNPVGLIASCFRPSDDATIFPFYVPSNLFAVANLRHLATMANELMHDAAFASECTALAKEVEAALMKYAIAETPQGSVWAFEVDGYGSRNMMDDANAPGLLSLPYLDCSPDPALYAHTRAFVWSDRNPYFFKGTAGEGIGGPHAGKDMIWPMSQIIFAATSNSDAEIKRMVTLLKASSAGTGFIHESYYKDDVKRFTRSWFAWANTIFGELMAHLAHNKPHLVA